MGVGALGFLVAPGAAFAQDAGGSSAFEPVIQAMANQLRTRTVGDRGSNGAVTLIYQTGGNSCGGVAAVRDQSSSSITAEEAANVWGCGTRGMISRWLVESAIQQRSATSGTQNIVARSINVLASSFHGTMSSTGGALVTTLTGMNPSVTIADRNTAIGLLAADAFDTQRAKMHALGFRGLEQTQVRCADWPLTLSTSAMCATVTT